MTKPPEARVADLAATIRRRVAGHERRALVAVAGPPGSGKSTLAAAVVRALGPGAKVVPMDGFHYDDRVLAARGLAARKGAPETFDVAGFRHLLLRLQREDEVAIPIFDRGLELSRAAADVVGADDRFLIVEGNYLLLNRAPWDALAPLFDLTIALDVPEAELVARLRNRWAGFGRTAEAAEAWITGNDLPNIRTVLRESRAADLIWP